MNTPDSKSKFVTLITSPTHKTRKFEDNVTVIRTFKPDKEKMLDALKLILRGDSITPDEADGYEQMS